MALPRATPAMADAMQRMFHAETPQDPWAVVSTQTTTVDGQAFVHWRTARALHEREFVRWGGEGEDARIVLSDLGVLFVGGVVGV